MNIKVSVIITTCNRSALLKRAINSVLNQSYKDFEIIIADDASTDDTEEIIKEYQLNNDNIIYIKHDQPMGANVGRNNAIKASNGEFIAGLDDDDEFSSNRIELLLSNYEDKYSLITSTNTLIYPNNKIKIIKKKRLITLEDMLFENLIGNQALIKKEKIIEIGLYDEHLKACQDYDMWLRLIEKFGTALCIDSSTQNIYMNHTMNRISTSNKRKFNGYFSFYKKHKHLMNFKQRKYQLFHLKSIFNKKINFKTYCVLFTFYNKKLYLYKFLKRWL